MARYYGNYYLLYLFDLGNYYKLSDLSFANK